MIRQSILVFIALSYLPRTNRHCIINNIEYTLAPLNTLNYREHEQASLNASKHPSNTNKHLKHEQT